MKVVPLTNQSLFDLALMEAGAIEGAFELAQENGLSVTDELNIQQVFESKQKQLSAKQQRIVSYYSDKQIKPATALLEPSEGTGINYMGIEIDFIVSGSRIVGIGEMEVEYSLIVS